MARPGLHAHRKFRRLVAALREPVPHVRGYLEVMWDCGYESGDPYLGDAFAVAAAAMYPGDAEAFTRALAECGFVDPTPGGDYEIHDLLANAPDYVRKRARRHAGRTAAGDGAERRQCPPSGGLRRTTADNGTQSPPTDGSDWTTAPNGSTPNTQHPTPTREEESSLEPISCTETGEAPVVGAGGEAPILTFPCDGNPKRWHYTASEESRLRAAFPSLDVTAQARQALAWVEADLGRKKTAKGMRRFLTSWMSRAQDRGAARRAPQATPQPAGRWAAFEAKLNSMVDKKGVADEP